ncbi:hypothetical protein JX266_014359, partial [Neoarthrinium moseri]
MSSVPITILAAPQHGDAKLDSLARRLIDLLENLKDHARTPGNFDARLDEALLPNGSVPATLLRAGFQPWFAYFIATCEAGEDAQALTKEIDELPTHTLYLVANKLNLFPTPQTIVQLYQKIFNATRGLLEEAGLRCPVAPTSDSTVRESPRPSKRPRVRPPTPAFSSVPSSHITTPLEQQPNQETVTASQEWFSQHFEQYQVETMPPDSSCVPDNEALP